MAVGIVLGNVGTIALERLWLDKQAIALPSPTATATVQHEHAFELSRSKIICDREHLAFDLADYVYCQQPPKQIITARPLTPAELQTPDGKVTPLFLTTRKPASQ